MSASGARPGTPATSLRPRLALAATAIGVASFAASPDLRGALGAALGWLMLAVAQSDARRFVVPDALTASAFALGLVDASLADGGGFQAPALAAAVLYAVELVYRRLRGRAGLGLGDVKLAGVAGAWLGVALTPAAIELAALAALAAYFMRQARKRRALNGAARLPFATFLAPAIWLVWLLATRFPPP